MTDVSQLVGVAVAVLISSGILLVVVKQTYSDKDRINAAYREGRDDTNAHLEEEIALLRADVEQMRGVLRDMIKLISPEHMRDAVVLLSQLNLARTPTEHDVEPESRSAQL